MIIILFCLISAVIILVFDLTSIKTLNNTKWAGPFYIIGWLSLSLAFWLIITIIIIVIIIIISTIIIINSWNPRSDWHLISPYYMYITPE